MGDRGVLVSIILFAVFMIVGTVSITDFQTAYAGEEIGFGSIHGFAFWDLDADGFSDAGEPPLDGVEFTLTGTDGMGSPVGPIIEATNADGEFWYEDLMPGDYTVTQTIPDGYDTTTHSTIDPSVTVTITSGQEYVWQAGAAMLPPDSPKFETIDDRFSFGSTITGSTHGFAFEDVNEDGAYNPGSDNPFPGVEFELTGIDGMGSPVGPIIVTTNGDGEFWYVDLKPGTYTVTQTIPDLHDTTTHSTIDPSVTVTIISGQEYVWIEGAAMLPDPLLIPKFETLDDRFSFGLFLSIIEVEIDVKPQSCPNPIKLNSKGVLPVAILGTDTFDVSQIDVGSITLEGVSPIRHSIKDVATPHQVPTVLQPDSCTDEGPDGFDDLTLKFNMQEIVAALGAVSKGDVISVELEGQLLDGTPIEGYDIIIIR